MYLAEYLLIAASLSFRKCIDRIILVKKNLKRKQKKGRNRKTLSK